jgi:hypothetical protein
MKRSAFFALVLVGFLAQKSFAQSSVTIDSSNVDKQVVTVAGKLTLQADEVYLGAAFYLENAAKARHPGFLRFNNLPDAAKTVDWDGSFIDVAAGDWSVIIVVRYLDACKNAKLIMQTKAVTVK